MSPSCQRVRTELDSDRLLGVLHDVGHELATLRYLLAEMRTAEAISADSARWLRDAEEQISRIGEIVGLTTRHPVPEPVSMREMLGRLAAGSDRAPGASVRLAPGPDVLLRIDPTNLWRMAANLVQNAARAAGAAGTVEIAVREEDQGVVVEIVDDGPGFGAGPGGTAARGLGIVTELARQCGAHLRIGPVGPVGPAGTKARLEFAYQPTVADGERIQGET